MTRRSPYLVGPGYDWAFFLAAPLVGLLLGILISGTAFSDEAITVNGAETTLAGLCIGSLIHAHLVAVFYRSHGNPQVFARHPVRFVVVPIAIWIALISSIWLSILTTVVVTFWDVWHSGAQTFGFARIYDRNAGNPPELGRRLDYWLNQLLYAGPILAGATLIDHVEVFDDVDSAFFQSIPAHAVGARQWIAYALLAAGAIFLAAYVYYYAQLRRRGYRVSWLKVYLLTSTGLCSIYTWGFNTWGEAFFIMNFFHGVQYLALVWATERKTIIARFRLGARRRAGALAAAIFFGSVAAYGVWAELLDAGLHSMWALTMVVSLMHFWYDGFIWSVRRREV